MTEHTTVTLYRGVCVYWVRLGHATVRYQAYWEWEGTWHQSRTTKDLEPAIRQAERKINRQLADRRPAPDYRPPTTSHQERNRTFPNTADGR